MADRKDCASAPPRLPRLPRRTGRRIGPRTVTAHGGRGLGYLAAATSLAARTTMAVPRRAHPINLAGDPDQDERQPKKQARRGCFRPDSGLVGHTIVAITLALMCRAVAFDCG